MTRRPHGLVYGLLALSLAINLIAAGFVGYQQFSGTRGKGGKGPRNIETTIDFIASRYPKSVADKVRERLTQRQLEIGTALDEMRVARRATRRAMRLEPLNKPDVEAAFANLREKSAAFQKLVHAAIIDTLPDVPEADRDALDKPEPD